MRIVLGKAGCLPTRFLTGNFPKTRRRKSRTANSQKILGGKKLLEVFGMPAPLNSVANFLKALLTPLSAAYDPTLKVRAGV